MVPLALPRHYIPRVLIDDLRRGVGLSAMNRRTAGEHEGWGIAAAAARSRKIRARESHLKRWLELPRRRQERERRYGQREEGDSARLHLQHTLCSFLTPTPCYVRGRAIPHAASERPRSNARSQPHGLATRDPREMTGRSAELPNVALNASCAIPTPVRYI